MKNEVPLSRQQYSVLSAILVVGALSRFLFLGLQSFWYDELFTQWACHYDSFTEFFKLTVVPDVHPPLYNTIIFCWAQLFGFSEISLRFPSAIFGFLAIYWVFKLGRISYSNNVGILAAALTTLFWFPLYMSQEARSYSLVLFLSAAFIYYHYKLFRDNDDSIKPKDAIWFGLLGCAMLYTHYYTCLFVVLSAGFLLAVPFRKALKLLLIYACIGASYLPWIPYILEHFSKRNEFWTEHFSPFALLSAFDFITINNRIYSILPVAIICFYLVKLAINRKNNCGDHQSANCFLKPNIYFLTILIVPFIFIYALSFVSKPLFSPRYYSFAYPAFVVFLAEAILGISRRKLVSAVLILAVFALSVVSVVVKENYYGIHKTDFRGAYQFMAEHESGKPLPTLVQGLEITKYPGVLYAYFNIESNSGRAFFSFDGKSERIDTIQSSLQLIGADSAWYLSDTRFEQTKIDSAVRQDFKVVSVTRFHWLDLYLLSKKDSSRDQRVVEHSALNARTEACNE